MRAAVVRSGVVESVCEADVAGSVVDGDPSVVAFWRSSSKPLQAAVCLEAGWVPAAQEHLAIACGSHAGEPVHVEMARAVLARAGLDERALAVKIDHNCSGKHAAMLATCVENDWPVAGYVDAQHPLQGRMHVLGDAAGVDGCGVPTFALPLSSLASRFGAVPAVCRDAMRAHPLLVAGTGKLDTDVMTLLPAVTQKGGAEGLLCGVIGEESFAIKIRDGSSRAMPVFLAEVLRRLGVLTDALAERLRVPVIGGGREVGEIRLI